MTNLSKANEERGADYSLREPATKVKNYWWNNRGQTRPSVNARSTIFIPVHLSGVEQPNYATEDIIGRAKLYMYGLMCVSCNSMRIILFVIEQSVKTLYISTQKYI